MADVDLLVAVTSAGVPNAISQIEALRKAGVTTAAGIRMLAATSAQASRNITTIGTAAAGGNRGVTNLGTVMRNSAKDSVTLTRQLNLLNSEYRRLNTAKVSLTPGARLRTGGGEDVARQIVALRELIRVTKQAANPNATRDLIAVEKERLRVLQQTAERLQRITAQENAKVVNSRAREDYTNQLNGITRVQQAQINLTRATQDLAKAEAARKATGIGRDNAARTAALNAETQALRQVASAHRELKSAEESHRDNDNAFQSSFSYFILAGLAQQATQGIIALGGAAITASSQIERGFVDVERTFDGTEMQLDSLQRKLIELSTTTPNSVIDLSEIATLGNQLGIAASDIEQFTTVIAQYTAVSGQSAEDAATAFGRISNLTGLAAADYDRLASAITYVARTTVATESTIQNTAKEISALSAGAGFSAQAIVGLAGALSSLAIPPERARGALSLYFGALNGAVAEGGPKLEAFAQLTGKTTDELNRLVRENKGQEVFTAFISGLSQLDTVAKTTALDTLGLSTIRVDQTMRALAQNVPLVTQSLAGSETAFQNNTEIGRQYALIQETLNSKIIEFQNSIQNAAGALGNSFAPNLSAILSMVTKGIAAFSEFAQTPLGEAFLKLAGAITIIVGVMATLVGALALAKASMVVLGFAINGLGWTSATAGLRGYVASMFIGDAATRKAALSQTSLKVALLETAGGFSVASVRARSFALALGFLKVALPIAAITAGIALIDQLATSIDKSINPSKTLTDDLSGLKDALVVDYKTRMGDAVAEVGLESGKAQTPVSEFNSSILAAIDIQKRAEGAFDSTTGKIDSQAFALGEASKAWIDNALKTQDDIADIIDGKGFWEQIWEDFSTNGSPLGVLTGNNQGGDSLISRDQFEELILGGLDIPELSRIAITKGEDAAMAAYDKFATGFEKANPDSLAADKFRNVLPRVLDSVTDAYGKAAVEAALAGGAIADGGIVAVGAASDFNNLGEQLNLVGENGESVALTFSGVTGRLADLQDGLQTGITKFVSFNDLLKKLEEQAKKDKGATKIDAPTFGADVTQANKDAVKFYNNITALAKGGSSSFALQLAEIGPAASNIVSTALTLDGGAQAKLETSARFAAFLASDAFKKTLQMEMSDSNEAYARIFQATGDLGQVQSYIAAQVAGTGAEWERQWLANNPQLPLNIDIVNPTAADIAAAQANLSTIKLTSEIKPTFDYNNFNRQVTEGSKTYRDSATGATITLPANLDKGALTASLTEWKNNQNAKPEDIASKLNTDGFSSAIDAWKSAFGPINLKATVQITNTPTLPSPTFIGGPKKKNGGIIEPSAYKMGGEVARFAGGGGYGMFRGPGGGRTDSIDAKVSAGEFINTADSTAFWGPDFFNSLNKKMLPTSFLNMLGAAAVSGNQNSGPQTHVSVTQVNPVTRDPLKQLREDSENVAAGIWK